MRPDPEKEQSMNRTTCRRIAVAWLLSFVAMGAQAADAVSVTGAWVRGTVAAQKTTGAYMDLSATEKVTLVGAASAAAAAVEIHRTVVENQVARMLPSARLDEIGRAHV